LQDAFAVGSNAAPKSISTVRPPAARITLLALMSP
jgi:hypothetical protein